MVFKVNKLHMRIAIEAKNFELTTSIREYTHKKFVGLDKFAGPRKDDEITSISIERLAHHRHGQIFRATVNFAESSQVVYAKGEGETAFMALDVAEGALKRELRRMRGKKRAVALKGDRIVKRQLKEVS